jgi:hypothetical protein
MKTCGNGDHHVKQIKPDSRDSVTCFLAMVNLGVRRI